VRANAFLRGGDPAAAIEECDKGLAEEKGKGRLPLLVLRGKALFEQDRFDEAKGAYLAALDVGRSEDKRALADVYLGLGVIASRQKDWPAARQAFQTLCDINDKDGRSHINVAKTCLAMGDIECALRHGREAGHLRGDEEEVLFPLGTIYLAAGMPAEAELTFQHICAVVPGAASCPYGQALVAARAGDKGRALRELDEAVRRKLPNPDRIAADPGFSSLKDDPEFLQIAARAGGSAQPPSATAHP
jgi:tetratricopeptide (TPR) repeat protein